MNYLSSVTRTRGYLTADREPEKPARRCAFGFVPAEIYLRERGLCGYLADACVWHTEHESKRPAHSIAEMLGLVTIARKNLRKRQTMQAIV